MLSTHAVSNRCVFLRGAGAEQQPHRGNVLVSPAAPGRIFWGLAPYILLWPGAASHPARYLACRTGVCQRSAQAP